MCGDGLLASFFTKISSEFHIKIEKETTYVFRADFCYYVLPNAALNCVLYVLINIFALLGYYTAEIDSSLPTFREEIIFPIYKAQQANC